MRRLLFAALSLSLVSACSSAQDDAKPPKTPPPARTIDEKPRAPRALTGQPVVLALRRPTSVSGVEWTWLMPEGRLVTLASPNAKGERAILGPNFFPGPNGAYVGLDVQGEFTLAADGQTHPLGKNDGALFDEKGERLLVWNPLDWSLVARDGTYLRTEKGALTRPVMLPDGTVIAARAQQRTIVVGPDGQTKMSARCGYEGIFPVARRFYCAEASPFKGREGILFSLDQEGELARFSMGSGESSVAVRADGGAFAVASGTTIEVFEITPGKKAKSHVALRRNKDHAWRAPRMGFTADGQRLCVEELDATRVIDPSASEFKNGLAATPPKGTPKSRTLCLFGRRGEDVIGAGYTGKSREWDARIVEVAAHEGYSLLPRTLPPGQWLPTEDLSDDQRMGAVAEYKAEEEADQVRWTERAVLFDPATGAEKRILPLGEHKGARYMSPEVPRLELSDDGERLRICAPRTFDDGCRTFSTETGEILQNGYFWSRARRTTQFSVWSGDLPDAAIGDVLASMSVPVESKAKVVAWRDEGKYITIELDPGDGSSVRMNLPDSPEHVVRDVQAVAGGAMLAFASQGIVELWKVQPLELTALLIGAPEGGAAMFVDGSVEAVGRGAESIGCQKGETIAPIDQCGDVWAEKGTLLAIMKKTKNENTAQKPVK